LAFKQTSAATPRTPDVSYEQSRRHTRYADGDDRGVRGRSRCGGGVSVGSSVSRVAVGRCNESDTSPTLAT